MNYKDRVPKKYQERVFAIEKENDLIDNCKYMLYLNDGWLIDGDLNSFPCKSIKEAIDMIKNAYKGECK